LVLLQRLPPEHAEQFVMKGFEKPTQGLKSDNPSAISAVHPNAGIAEAQRLAREWTAAHLRT